MKVTKNWIRDFNARAYLNEYYDSIGEENDALLKFLVESYKKIPANQTVLDFGGGPTVYQLIAAGKKAKEIHYSEYLENNRQEVRKWLKNDPLSFNWNPFTKRILELEGKGTSQRDIVERENETRRKIKKILSGDICKKKPVGTKRKYDVLSMQFVAESITDSRSKWKKYLKNALNLLKPHGVLIMSALKGAECYRVGNKYFPAVSINESDIRNLLLKNGFDRKNTIIDSVLAERPKEQKYQGLMFVLAFRDK